MVGDPWYRRQGPWRRYHRIPRRVVTCCADRDYAASFLHSAWRASLRGDRERALVGVPAVDAEARLLVVEPREEGELLHVVGEAVHRVREVGAGQRVSHLQVGLAAINLA